MALSFGLVVTWFLMGIILGPLQGGALDVVRSLSPFAMVLDPVAGAPHLPGTDTLVPLILAGSSLPLWVAGGLIAADRTTGEGGFYRFRASWKGTAALIIIAAMTVMLAAWQPPAAPSWKTNQPVEATGDALHVQASLRQDGFPSPAWDDRVAMTFSLKVFGERNRSLTLSEIQLESDDISFTWEDQPPTTIVLEDESRDGGWWEESPGEVGVHSLRIPVTATPETVFARTPLEIGVVLDDARFDLGVILGANRWDLNLGGFLTAAFATTSILALTRTLGPRRWNAW